MADGQMLWPRRPAGMPHIDFVTMLDQLREIRALPETNERS